MLLCKISLKFKESNVCNVTSRTKFCHWYFKNISFSQTFPLEFLLQMSSCVARESLRLILPKGFRVVQMSWIVKNLRRLLFALLIQFITPSIRDFLGDTSVFGHLLFPSLIQQVKKICSCLFLLKQETYFLKGPLNTLGSWFLFLSTLT